MSTQNAGPWRAAQQQFLRRDWPAARRTLQTILATEPAHAAALLQLSYVESHLGHYRAARACALRARQTGVRNPQLLGDLLARLRTFNEAELLFSTLQALPPPSQLPIPLLLSIAAQLSYLNLQEQSLPYLDEARRGDPDYPPMLLASAQVLIYLGRFREAEADLKRCLARAPGLAPAYWQLARLRRQTSDANHVDAIRTLLAGAGGDAERTALLAFALHKELDDLGDHAGAWQALEQACRAKRSLLQYDMAANTRLFDALHALPGHAEGAAPPETGAGRVPIFIIGMHRSGTTLLEQLLDGHAQVRGVGELYDFTSQMRYATDHHCRGVIDETIVARADTVDWASVGAGYLGKMEWRLGTERCFTDKLPSNFLNAGFICRALPGAKILHMVRDPVETCFSNLRELFSDANPYSYDPLELADYYRQYRSLMARWHEAWPGRILDVEYSALTREPEPTMRRVAEFCGLDYQPAMLDIQGRERSVATASAVQVRQGIVARDKPKWAPYAGHLQPMIDALEA
jgi:tetratricopeptide (TPR) repeat protein